MHVIKEMVDSSKKARNSRYEESNVVSDKLKKYYLILWPSPLLLLKTLWESGILIVVLQGSSSDRRKLSLI